MQVCLWMCRGTGARGVDGVGVVWWGPPEEKYTSFQDIPNNMNAKKETWATDIFFG